MDPDDYVNLVDTHETLSNSSISTPSPGFETKILILSTAKLVACSIGFFADIFIIFIICKCKNLKTPANLYIMHWLCSDAMFLFCDPAEYHFYRAIKHHDLPRPSICVIFSSNMIARIAEFTFITIILMHIYFEKHASQFFAKHYKKVIATIWLFSVLVVAGISVSCTLTSYDQAFGSLIMGVSSSVALVSFIGVHMKRRFASPFGKGENLSLPLAMVTVYFLVWAIYLLCTTAITVLFNMFHMQMVIDFTRNIIYLYPILFLVLFHVLDPKFSTCIKYMFRKKTDEEVIDYSGI